MKLFEIILSAITLGMVGVMFYITCLYINEKLRKAGGSHKPISFSDEARYNKKLDEIIFNIVQKTNASSVFIARLHNNGYWNNGRSMKKFTVILERYVPTATSVMQEYKDVLCSRYPEAMDFLFYQGYYTCSDLNLCKDRNLARDLQKHGFKSCYMFLINQANADKTEEAFIVVQFKEPSVLTVEQFDFVKTLRFDILGLLNMKKQTL
jgi:hypothetical protein